MGQAQRAVRWMEQFALCGAFLFCEWSVAVVCVGGECGATRSQCLCTPFVVASRSLSENFPVFLYFDDFEFELIPLCVRQPPTSDRLCSHGQPVSLLIMLPRAL